MAVYVIIIAGFLSAIGQYTDKHLANIGTNKDDYFYYMCLTMVPFAFIMVIVEYLLGQLKFEFSLISILLLVLAMILRYFKQHTIMGCLKYLNPYEDSAYLSLGMIVAFIIDVILGIENFEVYSILSIIITILGVFCIANSKLKAKNLQKDLIIRILATLAINYTTHFILQYWSNAIFMLILNVLLVILFSKNYTIDYHKKNSKVLKWCIIQQIFGFSSLYLSNLLSSYSVTLSSYVKPTSILIVLLISLSFKEKTKKPSWKQIIGILLVLIGIMLISF